MRSVVAGRLVNIYSENDYVLGFLYRTSSVQYGVAGLQKVEGIPSVENVDVSETVSGHLRYRYLVGSILKKIGFEDIEMAAVEKEEAAFQRLLEEEKKKTLKDKAQQSGQKVLEDNPLGVGHHEGKDGEKSEEQQKKENEAAEAEAQQMEKQIQEKTQKGMLQSAWGYLPQRLRGKGAVDAPGDRASEMEKDKEQTIKKAKASAAMGEDPAKEQDKGWTGDLTSGLSSGLSSLGLGGRK